MVLRWLQNIFGGQRAPSTEHSSPLFGLDPSERERIGTEEDPLQGFEAAIERHTEAVEAERNGDPERAIHLYETSVAEGFVGSHPYERLASFYERRQNYAQALRVCEAFVQLAASGRMPKGSQRSANRKLPDFEARIERYRRLLDSQ
ncbi:MAG: hypothetical protein M3392_12120 [Actinomycetota bacterium]|nr:hypothetical protein [Actinomycetota bacterium]